MGKQELDGDFAIPSAPDVERMIIGVIFLDNELMREAKQLLKTSDFYVGEHRKIFVYQRRQFEEDKPIDAILIAQRMQEVGDLLWNSYTDTIAFLVNMTSGIPHVTSIAKHAEVLRKKSKARWLLHFSERIRSNVLDNLDPDGLAQTIIEEVSGVSTASKSLRRPRTIEELYEAQATRFALFHKGISDAIPTGFHEMDSKLLGGGLLPSLMYVFAGRPSMGKTTLALDVLCNIADQGRRGMVVTRETPAEMLLDRMVSAKSGVDRFKISSGISEHDYNLAMETLSAMRLTPIVIDDVSSTISEIDGWLYEYDRAGTPIEFLMLDYLQLMAGEGGDGRTQEVSKISSGFKQLLTKWRIPGVAVSQLSRAPGDREPELHHLRESGQIEQDADAVLFLHGDQTEEDIDFLVKELICKKQRDGPHFRRTLDMNASLVTFRRPDMLGLPEPKRQIEPRSMGTDEEELAEQKARAQKPKARRKAPSEDERAFDY